MQILMTFMDTFLLVYMALFPVINPIGAAPVFLNLTQFCTPVQRHLLARKIAISSFFLLLGSLFIGSHVLSFFGIELPVIQIGGGIIVAALGWKLLNAAPVPDAHHDTGTIPSTAPEAFYPLTMPLTVDPGSISVAITIGSHGPGGVGIERLLLLGGAATAGLIELSLTIYLCYRFGEQVIPLLGPDGTKVIIRLSAFILFCIGIQIFWTGWNNLVHASP